MGILKKKADKALKEYAHIMSHPESNDQTTEARKLRKRAKRDLTIASYLYYGRLTPSFQHEFLDKLGIEDKGEATRRHAIWEMLLGAFVFYGPPAVTATSLEGVSLEDSITAFIIAEGLTIGVQIPRYAYSKITKKPIPSIGAISFAAIGLSYIAKKANELGAFDALDRMIDEKSSSKTAITAGRFYRLSLRKITKNIGTLSSEIMYLGVAGIYSANTTLETISHYQTRIGQQLKNTLASILP